MKKRLRRLILNTVLVFLCIPFALTYLFRDPMVQTLSARMVTTWLSSKVDNELSIKSININIQKGITLSGVLVKDHHGNTMIKLDHLTAKAFYGDLGLFGLRFSKIEMKGAEFRYGRYAEDETFNLMMLINEFSSGDTSEPKEKNKSEDQFIVATESLSLHNSLFHFFDEQKEYDNGDGMDYANMIFDSVFIQARDFKLIGDSLSLKIDSLATRELSGLKIKRLKTQFSIAPSGLVAYQSEIDVDKSYLDFDLEFKNSSYKTFTYFIDSVMMYGNIRHARVRMSDISHFSEVMKKMRNTVEISGEVSGTVADLSGKNLKAKYGRHTEFEGNSRITGLPDFFTSDINAEIFTFKSTSCDLKSFALPIDEQHIDYTEEFDCIDPFEISGTFNGSYYDFRTKLNVNKGESHLLADISYTEVAEDTLYFSADLVGDTLHIGELLHLEDVLGNMNCDVTVSGYGDNMDNLVLNADGLFTSVDLLGYNYRRISVDASYYSDTVAGEVRVGDPHLMMSAKGKLSIEEDPYLDVRTLIKRADLDELKFLSDYNLRVSAKANVRLKSFDLSRMEAYATISDSKLAFGQDEYNLKHLTIEKFTNENRLNIINIKSDIVDIDMQGRYDIVQFPDQIFSLFNTYYNAFPEIDSIDNDLRNYATIDLNLKKSNLISEQFVPGLEISTPMTATAYIGFQQNELDLETSPAEFSYQGISFLENDIKVLTQNQKLIFNLDSKYVVVKDSTESDKTVLGVDNFKIRGSAGYDLFDYGMYWDNNDTLTKNVCEFEGYLQTLEYSSRMKMTRADIFVNDTLWTVDANNLILADSSGIQLQNINIFGGISEMKLGGKVPQREGDSMRVVFNDWDLSKFDFITRAFNFDMDGIVNGNMDISLVKNLPAIVSDLTISDFYLNKEYLGTASLVNSWDNVNNSLSIQSNIIRDGNVGEAEIFGIDGLYYPFRDESSLDLDIRFEKFKLAAIESFVSEFVSYLEGVTSGHFTLKGSLDKPELTGEMDMKRTSFVVNYLNTKYSFSNKIRITPFEIDFDELVIYDTLGNFANVDGRLKHQYFSNSEFQVKLITDKLLFFNTTSKMNDLYYGTAIASGDIAISGSPSNVKLDMKVQTIRGTNVNLPLDYSVEISDKDYIIFVQPFDSLDFEEEEILEGKAKIEEEELAYDLKLGMDIFPNAKLTIFMPSDMGRIEGQGRGNLKMKSNSNGDFSLIGEYKVEEGIFHLSLANLVSKRFELVEGGRISWTGDPYEANVNIRGLYKLKTSLSGLGIYQDTAASYTNKVNVECYVILRNQLLNPDIKFEILFPNMDPDQKRIVYATLDTTNQALMNEQMISLLVLGTFNSNNINNVDMASASYAVLSNQLSSMLSKISDDFDIGINYKPGETKDQEEFEVALSTQLFDERLIIDGHFGMTYDKSGEQQSASNIVGDVDVGYKLTEDGRWILKAFNHSNVNSWYNTIGYEKIAPYTQGVGVAYRKEFTNISELFRRTRPKKTKKSEEKVEDVIVEEENNDL